jgi:hypothetical protein
VWPPALELKANTDWQQLPEVKLTIPSGTTFLEVAAGLQNCTGTVGIDDLILEPVLKGGVVVATPAAGGTEVSSDQRKAASLAPTLKLTENGIQFSPEIAQRMQLARSSVAAQKQAVLCIGPGAPAGKDSPAKWPKSWTILDGGKELRPGLTPTVVLEQLPEYLTGTKPEVVLIFGDPAPKHAPGRLDRQDWEDVAFVCLRMGAVPIVVVPGGAGGGVLQPAGGGNAATKDQPEEMGETRRVLLEAGEAGGLVMVEQVPADSVGERLGRAFSLIEKYVFARAPVEPVGGGTGKAKTPGKKDDDE